METNSELHLYFGADPSPCDKNGLGHKLELVGSLEVGIHVSHVPPDSRSIDIGMKSEFLMHVDAVQLLDDRRWLTNFKAGFLLASIIIYESRPGCGITLQARLFALSLRVSLLGCHTRWLSGKESVCSRMRVVLL